MDTAVFSPAEKSPNDVTFASVVIRQSIYNGRIGYHTGIYFRDPGSKELLFLHLAWHNALICAHPDPNYLWCRIPLPASRVKSVAVVCNSVLRANSSGKIPYAFSAPNDFFDPATGKLLLGPGKLGLTCATFVLSIFKAARIELVDLSSWGDHPDDAEWKEFIVEQLQQGVTDGKATQEHVDAIKQDMAGARFLPTEVMAAAFTPPTCNTMAALLPIAGQVQAKADAWAVIRSTPTT